jgi:hypothetical protein
MLHQYCGHSVSHAKFDGDLATLTYAVNGTGLPKSLAHHPADKTDTGALTLWAGAPEPVPQAGPLALP